MTTNTTEGGEMTTLTIDENGNWVEMEPEPYYPNILERIGHAFGIHQWTHNDPLMCVMCGKKKEL